MLKRSILEHNAKGRVIIIGDIHGCLEQFNNLLHKLKFHPEYDQLVLVGDLVNKGPDSIGVVKRAMALNAACVMGNQDAALLTGIARVREGEVDPSSPEHAEDPLIQLAARFPEPQYAYLRNLPHVLDIPQYNIIVVHAGFNPLKSMAEQNVWDLMHMRRVTGDGRAIDSGSHGTPWAKRWRGFPSSPPTFPLNSPVSASHHLTQNASTTTPAQNSYSTPTSSSSSSSSSNPVPHIVFGHDARMGLQQEKYATGLDAGCCYGGELAALVLPSRAIMTVPGFKGEVKRRPKLTPPKKTDPQTDAPTINAEDAPISTMTIAPIQSQPFLTPLEVIQRQAAEATFPSDTHHSDLTNTQSSVGAGGGGGISSVLRGLVAKFPEKIVGAGKQPLSSSSSSSSSQSSPPPSHHSVTTAARGNLNNNRCDAAYRHLFRVAIMLAPREETAAAALELLSSSSSPLADADFREVIVGDHGILPSSLGADLIDALISGMPHLLNIHNHHNEHNDQQQQQQQNTEQTALWYASEALAWVQDVALERPETLAMLSSSSAPSPKSHNTTNDQHISHNTPTTDSPPSSFFPSSSSSSFSSSSSQHISPSSSSSSSSPSSADNCSSNNNDNKGEGGVDEDRRRRLIATLISCSRLSIVQGHPSAARAIKATILALR